MPAIPEFVLRKLFVPGSLKDSGAGFSFELNNTFAPVSLNGLGVYPDDTPAAMENIHISMPGQVEISAAGVNPQNLFNLPVNVVISVRVDAPMPKKKLTIEADTREAGLLKFSIPVGSSKRAVGPEKNMITGIMNRTQNALRVLRARLDPQHPNVHFAPPANWMNDPNGLIYWQGNYHLFYQYNPDGAAWGNIHWGHAISKDMLRWQHLPVALKPDPNGADAGGCFSGCALIDHETPTLLYTGVFPEVQCLATSSSRELLTWQKHPRPVISAPPEGLQVEGFRDPCVWRDGREWRMVVGSGIHGVGGAILLYRSLDLREWEYLGILFQGDAQVREPLWGGTMWECPSFFSLGGKWVLILSACTSAGGLHTMYYTGQYRDNRFTLDAEARLLDYGAGGCYYAPQTFLDEHGRRVIFGWLREARSPTLQARAGWSGAMSFPRVLSLGTNGDLCCAPLDKISSLRTDYDHLNEPGKISNRKKGGCLEILLKVPLRSDGWIGVMLAADTQADACVRIGYDNAKSVVSVDCSLAGGLISEVPIDPVVKGNLMLHIFCDGSVLEVFINDQLPISARFYLPGMRHLRLRCVGNVDVEMWNLVT